MDSYCAIRLSNGRFEEFNSIAIIAFIIILLYYYIIIAIAMLLLFQIRMLLAVEC